MNRVPSHRQRPGDMACPVPGVNPETEHATAVSETFVRLRLDYWSVGPPAFFLAAPATPGNFERGRLRRAAVLSDGTDPQRRPPMAQEVPAATLTTTTVPSARDFDQISFVRWNADPPPWLDHGAGEKYDIPRLRGQRD